MNEFFPIHTELTKRLVSGDCGQRSIVTPSWEVRAFTDHEVFFWMVDQQFPGCATSSHTIENALHSSTSDFIRKPGNCSTGAGQTYLERRLDMAQNPMGVTGKFRQKHPAVAVYNDLITLTYVSACDEGSITYATPDRRVAGELELASVPNTFSK